MITATTVVGIDVSRDWLDGFCFPGGQRFRLANSAEGHELLVAAVRAMPGPVKIGFEATGGQEWVLWATLVAAGIDAGQLPPAQSEPSGRHAFETDGERYSAEAVAEPVGLVSLLYGGKFVQRSRGAIGPDGLVPEEYSLDRGRGDPPERAVFDWSHGKVEFAWRNERTTAALPEGAQDPISALHQIYFMQPMAMSSRVSVATGRKLGAYTYELLGDADLVTPLGLVRTIHVGRVSSDGSVLEVWLDRDRELLPVRIYSRDRKGTILDQVVREVALLQ